MSEVTPYISRAARCDLQLLGCTPEPLMAYLKALGILRLVSEQKDPEARGWWQDDVFWLRSPELFRSAESEEDQRTLLLDFFLEHYCPTPIVAPWAGGSGFFAKDNKEAVAELLASQAPRVALYREVIHKVQRILAEEGLSAKPEGKVKQQLISRYRRELPDEVVAWMDAAIVIQENKPDFAPLLGTGGNDGRLDFTQNFMQRLVSLGVHKPQRPAPDSKAWLESALFAKPARLASASVGQFSPGRAGGPNATQGMEGEPLDNPWDFVLLMEGTLVLAGAAVRRYGVGGRESASFPFTVRTVAAGFDSASSKDQTETRGEIWLPLWSRPATLAEIRMLFGEGRAEVSGRPARNGVDFARAAVTLGVDRGIDSFSRVGFLKRSGKAFLAAPLARFSVSERAGVDLFREVDGWLEPFRSVATSDKAPPRLGTALRRIESAIFDYCKYGGERLFQEVLVALGQAERELAGALRSAKNLRPLMGLSADWIRAANDQSPEFALAQSLAFLYDAEGKVGPLRANLEPVAVHYDRRLKRQMVSWAEQQRAVAWNAADLDTNLARVLERRLTDGVRAGCSGLPLASPCTVSLDTLAAFLEREVDDRRIEDLIWGLMLVDAGRHSGVAGTAALRENPVAPTSRPLARRDEALLPREYALLKLLFLPAPLVAETTGGGVRWRLAHRSAEGVQETGLVIRPEPRILPLLRAGRVGEACRIAAQRLRASGLPPMPGPGPGGFTRDSVWGEHAVQPRSAQRLAAALLLPLGTPAIDVLVKLVCRDSAAVAEALSLS